jgi:endonuclease/exonuclease/phosphatase family metal-dependent hydrolase
LKIIILIKKYFKNILLGINAFFAFLLLVSYLASYVSPLKFYPIAFLGLIYPFLLLFNLIFIPVWVFRKSKYFLISTLSIAIGWNYLTGFFQISNKNIPKKNESQMIKVLSYNVRIFDLWEWSAVKKTSSRIFSFIRKSKFDIVCLQEFYSKNETGKNAKDSLLTNSVLKYSHVGYTLRNNKPSNYGIAIFSRYPIVNRGRVFEKESDNYCIYSDLKIDKDTLRVYNIHLESIHLGAEDHHIIEKMNSTDSIDIDGLKSIYWKFKKSYKKRAQQVNTITRHLKECKYPLILCGDFNDTPASYVYKQIKTYLKDSFRESGNGICYTYVYKWPFFRIDYIMHSPQLNSYRFKSPGLKLSDHFPVQCYIVLE